MGFDDWCAFETLFSVPLRNGLTRPKSIRGSGVQMVNMGEIFAHARIGDIPMDRVPLSAKEKHDYLLQSGDLLFARQSLVLSGAGKCCLFLGGHEPVTFESHLIRARLDRQKADPRFYFYFFSSRLGREVIEAIVEQVAAAGIRASDLARLSVPVPPLEQQRVIADILSALDDKIELNRRMNETLEAMAQAIFRSWFVDFDPVRAKAEGRQPVGMDAETAGLFPDGFHESALGEIPNGWRAGRIGEICCLSREAIDPGSFPAEVFDHFSIPAFDEGRTPKRDVGKQILSTKTVVPAGAVLLSKLNPDIPRVWLPTVSDQTRSLCSTEFLVVLPRGSIRREYLYSLFNTSAFTKCFASLATGTSGSHQRVKAEHFLTMDTVVPSPACIEGYSRLAAPLFAKVAQNAAQSGTLAAIRDALLPKLMSGEIRVQGVGAGAEASR